MKHLAFTIAIAFILLSCDSPKKNSASILEHNVDSLVQHLFITPVTLNDSTVIRSHHL